MFPVSLIVDSRLSSCRRWSTGWTLCGRRTRSSWPSRAEQGSGSLEKLSVVVSVDINIRVTFIYSLHLWKSFIFYAFIWSLVLLIPKLPGEIPFLLNVLIKIKMEAKETIFPFTTKLSLHSIIFVQRHFCNLAMTRVYTKRIAYIKLIYWNYINNEIVNLKIGYISRSDYMWVSLNSAIKIVKTLFWCFEVGSSCFWD